MMNECGYLLSQGIPRGRRIHEKESKEDQRRLCRMEDSRIPFSPKLRGEEEEEEEE